MKDPVLMIRATTRKAAYFFEEMITFKSTKVRPFYHQKFIPNENWGVLGVAVDQMHHCWFEQNSSFKEEVSIFCVSKLVKFQVGNILLPIQ